MIFWIMIILTVGFIILVCLNKKLTYYSDSCFWIGLLGGLCSGFTSIALLIMMVCNIVTYDGMKSALDEQYKSLIYKSQTEACRDEFGIVDKEYIDEVQNWNMDVVKYKQYTNSFWIGNLYPNFFNEYKTIDLESIQLHK